MNVQSKLSILMNINFCMEKIYQNLKQHAHESQVHFRNYGIAVLIGCLGFYFINQLLNNQNSYDSFLLRLFSGGLAFPLIFADHWFKSMKPWVLFYWYGTLIYTLPFFFTFMLLNNPSLSLWHVNGLVGLVVLALFVDWLGYLILVSIGIAAGFFAYSMVKPAGSSLMPEGIISVAINYAPTIVYMMLFSQKKVYYQKFQQIQEKLHHMKMLAGSLAHELRTPLSAVSMGAQSLGELLPIYQRTYAQAKEAKLAIEPLSTGQEQSLADLPEDLLTIANNAHTVINMLLMNLKENPDYPLATCSMNHCVEEALKSYPFSPPERLRMHWRKGEDFTFKGHTELMKHVLFNLIKNALYATAGKGEIFIHLEFGNKTHRLVFKDTGKGIASQDLPHVFDRFYTRTQHGTGIGLAFCSDVLTRLGGSITCDSVEREHTTFTLHLPALLAKRLYISRAFFLVLG